MKTKIPLIPLFEENKTEEILQHIKSERFDPLEISENGRSLLAVALLLGKYNIADNLMQYHKKNNIAINLNNMKYKNESIIRDIIDNKDLLEGMYIFFKRHNLNINICKFDFVNSCRLIANAKLEKNKEYLSCFRKVCEAHKNNINALDPLKTIMKLGKIGSHQLIEIYYDICDFNNIDLTAHPSFILLKDVLVNAPKYFNSQVYVSSNENSNHINKEAIIDLSKILEEIKDNVKFNKYFKGNKDINACLSRICYTTSLNYSTLYNLEPYTEYVNLSMIINDLSNKKLMGIDDAAKLVKTYLEQWPIHYFNGKSYADCFNDVNDIELTVNEHNDRQFNTIITKYNLLGISFSKDIEPSLIISIFEKFDSAIKNIFNLENEYIGNNQIWFNFSSRLQEKRDQQRGNNGFFRHGNLEIKQMFIDTLVSSEDINKMVSILVHEYTHFMQLNNDESKKISNDSLHDLGREAYKWVEFSKEDFANFYLKYILEGFGFSQSFFCLHKKLLIESVVSSLDIDIPLSMFPEKFLNKIDNLLDSDEGQQLHTILNNIVPKNLNLVKAYYISEQERSCSYEFTLWMNYDKEAKQYYWCQPVEIHARLNENLLFQKIGEIDSTIIINPKKLEAMKDMIENFNEIYLNNYLTNNKKTKPKF